MLFLLVAYVLLGPLPWAALVVGLLAGRKKMERLRKHGPRPVPDDPPLVCAVVPAKDEAGHVGATLRSVLALDWPGLRIVAVDDRSADGTAEIMDGLAAADGRLRVVRVRELPAGWLGKSHALHVATRDVSADWLLFVDSDVLVEPPALRDVMALAAERGWAAVSLLSRLRPQSFVERWLVPICAAAWGTMFLISRTNSDSHPTAAANGQFLLVRRAVYEAVGGHAAVRHRITEDVALFRNLKAAGHKVRFLAGGHLVSTQMHATWPQILGGWARIYTGTADGRVGRIAAALLLCLGTLAPLALVWLGGGWAVAAGVHLALVTIWYLVVYKSVGWAWLAIAWPATSLAMAVILAHATRRGLAGTVDWRGAAVRENASTEPRP